MDDSASAMISETIWFLWFRLLTTTITAKMIDKVSAKSKFASKPIAQSVSGVNVRIKKAIG